MRKSNVRCKFFTYIYSHKFVTILKVKPKVLQGPLSLRRRIEYRLMETPNMKQHDPYANEKESKGLDLSTLAHITVKLELSVSTVVAVNQFSEGTDLDLVLTVDCNSINAKPLKLVYLRGVHLTSRLSTSLPFFMRCSSSAADPESPRRRWGLTRHAWSPVPPCSTS